MSCSNCLRSFVLRVVKLPLSTWLKSCTKQPLCYAQLFDDNDLYTGARQSAGHLVQRWPTTTNHLNLCLNARDTSEHDGELTVLLLRQNWDTSWTSCSGKVVGDYVILGVHDNGEGIDADAFDRIFDPLFTTKAPGLGSGMGLSMAHGIVH